MKNYGTELQKNLIELEFERINLNTTPSVLKNIICFNDLDIVIIIYDQGLEWIGEGEVFEQMYMPAGLTVVNQI